MSNSPLNAFFIGRATAEAVRERVEDAVTDALGSLGKFTAEQQEQLRIFVDTVLEKADQTASTVTTTSTEEESGDLQEIIDNLRFQIAELKSELQQYRND
ncbi:MAG: DUF6825 family protein [Pseudanabaena sp. ELA607]|jgi:polyhydroxyalkanoate synthesis regulator phasin